MTTCGFAVPLFEHKGDRSELLEFSCRMGELRMDEYRHERNQRSIDYSDLANVENAIRSITRFGIYERVIAQKEYVAINENRSIPALCN